MSERDNLDSAKAVKKPLIWCILRNGLIGVGAVLGWFLIGCILHNCFRESISYRLLNYVFRPVADVLTPLFWYLIRLLSFDSDAYIIHVVVLLIIYIALFGFLCGAAATLAARGFGFVYCRWFKKPPVNRCEN